MGQLISMILSMIMNRKQGNSSTANAGLMQNMLQPKQQQTTMLQPTSTTSMTGMSDSSSQDDTVNNFIQSFFKNYGGK